MGFANLVYFFTVSLSLFLLEAECANVSITVTVRRSYHRSLKMMTDILLGDDPTPGHNALVCPVTYARDAVFLLQLSKGKSRSRGQNMFLNDLRTAADDITNLTSGDAIFNTTLYAHQKDITRNVNKTINAAFSEEEFSLITDREAPDSANPWTEQNQSFAIDTKMSWNITTVQWVGSVWSEFVPFFSQNSTSSIDVRGIRTVGEYDYAEFEHPKAKDCKLKTLRLNYTPKLKLNFVLLLNNDNDSCSAEQNLWTSMKDVDFRSLNYSSTRKRFVSIPFFKAIQNADLKKRLEDSPLGKPSASKTEYFHDASLEHSLQLNFAPKIPPLEPLPMISGDTPAFSVDHSFYFAISHEASPTPVLAALIANPQDITRNVNETINAAFSKENVSLIAEREAPDSANPLTEQNQSFAIDTKMSWNITTVQWTGHAWIELVPFFSQNSTSSIEVRGIRTVGVYDYAEFEHPKAKDCKLKTLRLNYTPGLKLNFVIRLHYDNDSCSAERSLWTSMKDVDFRSLNYDRTTIRFVSIPFFKATQNADLKKRLEDSPLGETSASKTEYFHDASLEHSLQLNFAPHVDLGPIPGISRNTPAFSVDHSFYFAISHEASPTPVLAALIANPQDITRNVNETIHAALSKENISLITEREAPDSANPSTKQNQSFAIDTKMSWNVTTVQWTGHAWSESFQFLSQNSTSPIEVRGIRTVGEYAYAEFEHPKAKDCKLKTLRLNYTPKLKLNFVLLLNNDNDSCSAEQSLWTSMKDVDFRRLNYDRTTIRFVSIPFFKATQNADLKKRLEDSPLGKSSASKTEYFHDASLEHSLQLNFAPKTPPLGPIPRISRDTPAFSVDHSFYFALSHKASPTPVLAALIANPQE